MRVAIFTDNDFDKVNGVTTTLRAVLKHAPSDLQPRVYTLSDLEVRQRDYLALAAPGAGIPFYREMKIYLPRALAFLREARADGVRLIHLTTPGPAGLASRWVAGRMRIPMAGSFHTHLAEYTEMLSGSRWLGASMNAFMRWVYRPCDPVLVPSAATRRLLTDAGWERDRIGLWSRGVDTLLFNPARRSAALREAWRVSDRRPAVLYAGRISREKGLADMAAIASQLAQLRASCRLIFVGDGPFMPDLRALCPDAVFMGTQRPEQVAIAMASADIFLFPSATDALGNVVLEAQASGLPVVVSDRGGPRENMLPGASGFVCQARNAAAFADRVGALVHDAGLRAQMGGYARGYANRRSWASALQPLYQAWRERATERAQAPGFRRWALSNGRLP